jgi:hypothetical protein
MLFFEKSIIYETYFLFKFIYSLAFIFIAVFWNSLILIALQILWFLDQILRITILEAANLQYNTKSTEWASNKYQRDLFWIETRKFIHYYSTREKVSIYDARLVKRHCLKLSVQADSCVQYIKVWKNWINN